MRCVEEETFHKEFIDKEQLKKLIEPLKKSEYGDYLLQVIKDKESSLYSHMSLNIGN